MEYFKDLRWRLAVAVLLCINLLLLVAGLRLPHWQETLLLAVSGLLIAAYLMRRTSVRVREFGEQLAKRETADGAKQE